MICELCAYADIHGWWGPSLPSGKTHHRCCHLTVSGKRPHCTSCCATFTVDSAASKHRRDGKCMDPATVTGKTGKLLLHQRADGLWSSPPGAKTWNPKGSASPGNEPIPGGV